MAVDLIQIPEDLGSGGSHLAPSGSAGSPTLLEILQNLQRAVRQVDSTVAALIGGDAPTPVIQSLQVPCYAPTLQEGMAGYVVLDSGGLARTDAGDPSKTLTACGLRGPDPGVAIIGGLARGLFTTAVSSVRAGEPVFLARADIEPNSGAAGKLTTRLAPTGVIARCGIVWTVPPNFQTTRLAVVLFHRPLLITRA